MAGVAREIADKSRVFHWPLEFPDVMSAGGFDAVIGNPPWDVMQLVEEEFFAQRLPEVAALTGAARKQAIGELERSRSIVFEEFRRERHRLESRNEFSRVSGRFPLTGSGRMNSYALFAELFSSLVSPRGRAGVIVPTGIATDATTALFFAALMTDRRLFSLHDFQTGLGFFDRIGHARFKFCLLTLGSKHSAPEDVAFSFFSRTMAEFNDKRRHFKLSRSSIARMNPDTMSVPVFRVDQDAQLATKLYAVAGVAERPLSWLSLKQNVFSSSNEADLNQFESVKPGGEDAVAIYRGAMFHQYDHAFASNIAGDFAQTLDSQRFADLITKSDKYVEGRYYQDRICSKGIRSAYHLAIRRIARPTDERTMIAAMLPAVGVDDTASIVVVHGSIEAECCLLANLNSLVFDYACTQKIGGTDIRKHNFSQLPILGPSLYSASALTFVIQRVQELTYTTKSLTAFARDIGYAGLPHAWNEERRAVLQAELDVWFARAYGLTHDELRYILDPSDPLGDDFPSETFRVLKNNELRTFGEYRTRRLVLEAWDRLEAGDLK